MRTWSIENLAVGALQRLDEVTVAAVGKLDEAFINTVVGLQRVIDAGITIKHCFRGPGHDWDTALEDGPEQLAEAEAEEEVWEPPNCCCGRSLNYFVTRDFEHEEWRHSDDNTPQCVAVSPRQSPGPLIRNESIDAPHCRSSAPLTHE